MGESIMYPEILTYIMKQTVPIVILSYFIWDQKQTIKDLLTSLKAERTRNSNLSEDVIKIATLWEVKAEEISTSRKEKADEIHNSIKTAIRLIRKLIHDINENNHHD
jgi:hypothetical protein